MRTRTSSRCRSYGCRRTRCCAATARSSSTWPFTAAPGTPAQSQWQGRSGCNDFSIGIELEGTDSSPYESIQYVRLARLITALCGAYPALSAERVVGHSDVAPGRKTDPGVAFDWPLLRALLRFESELAGT